MATNFPSSDSYDPGAETPQPSTGLPPEEREQATNLIREKVARIYAEEPDAAGEVAEVTGLAQRSKHQQFMYDLTTSGKDLATIQTEWHDYYVALPEEEKQQVWREFYASNNAQTSLPAAVPAPAAAVQTPQAVAEHKSQAARPKRRAANRPQLRQARSAKEIQSAIRDKVSSGGTLTAKHHLQSLGFGLGMGALAILIFLFSFFNELIIAPFIQPSRVEAATPVIVGTSSLSATPNDDVIIPKINVEIPVDYSETSTNENVIENDLEDGVVHYPTTVMPGQDGNAAFFGHSSNNIFNGGKYKFAFVLLHTLVPGDTFYLTYQNQLYVYKVISKTVVNPSDVGVLGPVASQTATATLITCDPPGTSINRLVVVGQQISPDPSTNTAGAPLVTATSSNAPSELPGNGPTLWTRVIRTIPGKVIFVLIALGFIGIVLRRIHQWREAVLH